METLLHDLRYGIRMMLKKPGFTASAVIALALGIGANTAIFSVVNALLLRPLPYKQPDRLAMVWMNNTRLKIDQDWHSYPNFTDYRDQNQVFEQMAAFNNRNFNLSGDGEPERVVGAIASADLFPLLGVDPMLGRAFTAEEDTTGKDLVAILGHGLWQRRFGSDPDIVGKSISVNGVSRTVIGVMPAGFSFPQKDTEMWVPLAPPQRLIQARSAYWIQAIGRLKPGVSVEQAQAEMGGIAGRLEQQYPELSGYGVNIVGLHEQTVGSIRPALLVLLGAVAFVLLIACANVANLLLARAAAREREIAIRTALGAGRMRLIRQLLTESMLMSLLGGAAGILIAVWGLSALIAISPADIPRLDKITIDGRVLGFTVVVSMLTGLVFGIVPALQASKLHLNESLKEGSRGSTAGARGSRARSLLVISEVALSLVLLIGAGLMIKSFIALQKVNLGFEPDRLLTMRLQLSGTKYREGPPVINFYKELLQRVEALPGVQSAGAISSIFLSKTPNSGIFTIEGRPDPPPSEMVEVPIDVVSSNYFQVMGIPLLKGRTFEERDVEEAPQVVIINETMARRFWPDEDPIGKRFKYGDSASDGPWMSIVGVVGDMRRTGFDAQVRPETFLPHAQAPANSLTLVVRTASNPLTMASPIRSEALAIDKDQPVSNIKTMDQLLGDMMAQRRLNMLLLTIFASVALLLAGVGIYGVMAYTVTQRTHEIGLRMAMGAQSRDVLRLVVGQGMTLASVGVGIGLVVAFALTRLMTSLLYGVSASDPLTFLAISLLLAGVAFVACYIPARRAAKVDPMVALRYE